MLANRLDLSGDDTVETFAVRFDALDHQAEFIEGVSQLVDGLVGRVDELIEPRAWNKHGGANSLELPEQSSVVVEKDPQVLDLVAVHGEPVDAEAPCETRPFFRVDAAVSEDVGMHHSASAELNPTGLATDPTTGRAERTGDLELGTRFREREETRTEARFQIGASEVGGDERFDRAGQVPERDALVDDECLDLVEYGQMTRIGRVDSVAASRHHRIDRRLHFGHHPELHRRRMRTHQYLLFGTEVEEECVVHRARRVARRKVELDEVVVVGLDLRTIEDLEAHAQENVLEITSRARDEMKMARLDLLDVLG